MNRESLQRQLAPDPEPIRPERLSRDLNALLRSANAGPMSLGQIEQILKDRGFAVFIMLLAVPFIIPHIPGLSIPFGFAIAVMGLRIAGGRTPRLPKFLRRKKVSYAMLERLVSTMVKLLSKIENLMRPRMQFLQLWPGMINVIGLGIASGGFFLMLPLPIPFTNTLPALSVLFLTAGMMEKDGLLILCGHLFAVISWAYLVLLIFIGRYGVETLMQRFG